MKSQKLLRDQDAPEGSGFSRGARILLKCQASLRVRILMSGQDSAEESGYS